MNTESFVSSAYLPEFSLWDKLANRRSPLSFDLEITARCNNDCRHCYINLPAGDPEAKRKELSLNEISDIADQAVGLGALWCLITGGEPLLNHDHGIGVIAGDGVLGGAYVTATSCDDHGAKRQSRYGSYKYKLFHDASP